VEEPLRVWFLRSDIVELEHFDSLVQDRAWYDEVENEV
jgi:hypothetical protein